jgi:hypothetical protein
MFKLLPEAARLAVESGYKLDNSATIETELWLILKQQELERAEESWVADRCAIDLLAYIKFIFPNEPELIKLAIKLLEPYVYKYNLIVYLPSGQFPITEDGLRNTDKDFQLLIDKEIKEVLKYYRLSYIEITGDQEERVKKLTELVKHAVQD